MTKWEYLFLEIDGHNTKLKLAQNMLVTTSDGRWEKARMPKDVIGIGNQLGSEGWEMIGSSGSELDVANILPHDQFEASFRRPLP
jgi:hypothetical protein